MCVCLLNPLCIILPLYLVYALAVRLFSLNSFGLTHLNFLCFYLFISCAIVLLLFLHLLKRRLFCFTIPYTRNAAKCCRNNSSNKASGIIWQLVSKYELVSASRSLPNPPQPPSNHVPQSALAIYAFTHLRQALRRTHIYHARASCAFYDAAVCVVAVAVACAARFSFGFFVLRKSFSCHFVAEFICTILVTLCA